MKAHSPKFKENIKLLGRELDSKISYTIDGVDYELGNEDLNSITPNVESYILKSAMRGLRIDSNVEIPEKTIINYKFGVKVRQATENDNGYDYINYGDYIVKSVEKQEDTNSYEIIAYDFMLNAMKEYNIPLEITYPISIRDYISAICERIGLQFKNENDEFVNYDKEIQNELYIDINGNSLGYTYRDILDELSAVTASTICIDLETNELEVRYITLAQGKNLFDKDNPNMLNAFFTVSTTNVLTRHNDARTIYISCKPNTTYTISKIPSTRFYVGYVKETPTISTTVFGRIGSNTTTTPLTITTGDDALYLVAFIYYSRTDTLTLQEILDSIQIEEGSEATDYVPFSQPDTIDEEYLKNVNVKFGQKFGPINTIVLTRSGESDSIFRENEESVNLNGRCELQIKDNQIMNFNDRGDYAQAILDKLNGLEYFINDFQSTGICYYDICDKYSVQIGEEIYSCILFNDEVNITQGLEENIYTDMPDETNLDYSKVSKDDRMLNQVYVIADKVNKQVESYVGRLQAVESTSSDNASKVATLQTSVSTLQTDTYTKIEINEKLTDGSVTKVKSALVTTDNTGTTWDNSESNVKTKVDANGLEIIDKTGALNETLLEAKYDSGIGETVIRGKRIIVEKYLIVGTHSRFEDYENGTGCFYLG